MVRTLAFLDDLIELRDELARKIGRDRVVPERGLSAFDRAERLRMLAKMDADILRMKPTTLNL